MSIYKGNKLVAGGSIDTHFVRKPAWSQAVAISVEQLYAGYTAPSDGMIVCTGVMPTVNNGTHRIITVNGIDIVRGQYNADSVFSYGSTSCPVSEGDLIKSSTISAWNNETRYFVPFEDSTVSESDIEVVTPELIRNLQSPDWSKAVKLNVTELYSEGYNVPSNGIIVGYFVSNPASSTYLKINNITVARSTLPPDTTTATTGSDSNVQCPVNKGDHITLEPTNTVEVYKLDGGLDFVPYKAQ